MSPGLLPMSDPPRRPELQCAHSTKDSELDQAPTVDLQKVTHSPLHPFSHLLSGNADEHTVLTKTESGAPHKHLQQILEYHGCLINKDLTLSFVSLEWTPVSVGAEVRRTTNNTSEVKLQSCLLALSPVTMRTCPRQCDGPQRRTRQ